MLSNTLCTLAVLLSIGNGIAAAATPLEARAPPAHLLRWVCTGQDSDDIPGKINVCLTNATG